jgi:hypothetical protein
MHALAIPAILQIETVMQIIPDHHKAVMMAILIPVLSEAVTVPAVVHLQL